MLNHKPQFWCPSISTKKTQNFQQHAEIALIEKTEKQTNAEKRRTLLKRRGDFWALKPKILYLDGLNQELNNID